MADRPQGPAPGTPEYEWLYGKGSDSDDATRVLGQPAYQQMPPPGTPERTRALPTGVPPAPGPPQPPPGPPPGYGPPSQYRGKGGGGRRTRRRLHPFRWLFLLLVLWLAFLLAVPFMALGKMSRVDAFPDGSRPADQPGTTYLIVGSDSRAGLSKEDQRRLGTGSEVGERTDTMMLLHVGDGPDLLMSIPRDSIVEIPGRDRSAKINGTTNPDAYDGGGTKLLIETIELNTGIRIDHYVEIGFGSFVDLVDAVGGIEICPEEDMKDKDAHLDIKAGCQEADGLTALGFARSRKSSASSNDLTRARNQRAVIGAIGKEMVSPMTVINPFRYWEVNMAAAQAVRVSEGTGVLDLARFARAITSPDLTCGVPIADLEVHWDSERSGQMFTHIINDDTAGIPDDLCTATGLRE
ncbi:LCP family protein [Nocardioides sp. AE5]|uniref:LCP family protein n=1 Tax=Nocardioides sp. AE5 TaxID=2962573 RepID=UPI00288239DF|nr:LCP family protein [Nocardioides sp. AE5]MDT0201899.1 LCP family protein [Nocardioides sp. AE5]